MQKFLLSLEDPHLACLHPRRGLQMAPLPLLLIATLLPVIRMVDALECPSCAGSSSSCTGQLVTCGTDEDVCISMSVQHSLTIGKYGITGSSKSCAVSAKSVNNTFRFDFGEGRQLNFAAQLCGATGCDASFSDISLVDYFNGKSCPRCYKPGYRSCEDNGTVYCYGDFDQCATISGEIKQGDSKIPFVAKGCASNTMKDLSPKLPVTIVSDPYSYTFDRMSFQSANGAWAAMRRITFSLDSKDLGPQVAFFFPCFLGIFAVKIFS